MMVCWVYTIAISTYVIGSGIAAGVAATVGAAAYGLTQVFF